MFVPKTTDETVQAEELNAALVSSEPAKAIIWDPIGTGCMACCSGNPEPLNQLFSVV